MLVLASATYAPHESFFSSGVEIYVLFQISSKASWCEISALKISGIQIILYIYI